MNRGVLGFLILAVFLAVGLWSAHALTDFHQPLADQLEEAATLSLAGDLSKATAMTEEVKDQWQTHWNNVAILADHTPMDEIDGLFARLDAFAKAGNASEFAACCKQLSILISATAEAHALSLKNIL